ncbi:MAG: flagellar filament capping protein FliD, partial [Lachnospiraceae bacterium]|nr:flagellar filament capping protein FliD [Lachnospiraceae bacterium]
DVQLDKDIDRYKDRVSTLQEKMIAEQDKYYKQFSAMETAMAKLQSQQTYISQLFGG